MSSLEISRIVESNHADVRRSIERLANRGVITLSPLAEVSNDGPGPKTISVYNLCKRDSLVVVAQLCPEFTAKVVDRWQELEAQVAQNDPLERLSDPVFLRSTLLTYTEKVIALEAKVEEQAPKVAALKRIEAGEKDLTFTQAAKVLGVKREALIKRLHAEGWIYPQIRRSTETTDRKAAQEYHDKLKASLWRQAKLGEAPDRSFEEAAVRFLREAKGQGDYATKLRHVAYWRERFAGRPVRSLTSSEIVDALPTHRINPKKPATPLTNATLNRHLATIRRMLSLCVEWEWIDRVPKLPKYHEPKVRVRWEPQEVIAALIGAMSLQWMRDAALVAVSTGLRESELFGLTPAHVDLAQRNAWITHASKTSIGMICGIPGQAGMCSAERR